MKKYIFLLFAVLSVFQLEAQDQLNNYKYIIIPESYDFTQGKDNYQLNSLTKFLFNREGYEAFIISDSLPQDLFNNRCLALSADAEKLKSSLFKTEIQINLKDCYGKIIYTSKVGSSKQKDFDKAYTQALRNAFESFEEFEYQYKPKFENNNQKNQSITQSNPKAQVISEITQNEKNKEAETVSYNVKSVEYTETSKTNNTQESKKITQNGAEAKPLLNENIYYAQATESGYKLVDSEPKLIMELIRTAQKNTFSVKGKDAIVFKEEGFWYYSEIVEGRTVKTLLNIKFYD
jgi:hypothetical protein